MAMHPKSHMKMFGSMMNMISDMSLKAQAKKDKDLEGATPPIETDGPNESPETPSAAISEMSHESPDVAGVEKDESGAMDNGLPGDFTKNLLSRKKPKVRQTAVAGFTGGKPKGPSPMDQVFAAASKSETKRGRGRPRGSKKA